MYYKVAWFSVGIALFSAIMGGINKLFGQFINTQQIVSWFHVSNTFILFGIFFLLVHFIQEKK